MSNIDIVEKAIVYLKNSEWQKAINEAKRALQIDPNCKQSHEIIRIARSQL